MVHLLSLESEAQAACFPNLHTSTVFDVSIFKFKVGSESIVYPQSLQGPAIYHYVLRACSTLSLPLFRLPRFPSFHYHGYSTDTRMPVRWLDSCDIIATNFIYC